jgi:hypothetical protein
MLRRGGLHSPSQGTSGTCGATRGRGFSSIRWRGHSNPNCSRGFHEPSLPGGGNLIPTLNAQGFLDVIVQDDSAVDFISLAVTPCRRDVYMKDNAPDFGAEPSSPTVWSSPDIRICQTPGCVGNQNPEYGQTNYVYVKLRNTGPNAPWGNGPAAGTLRLYYTASGGGALWDIHWTPIPTRSTTPSRTTTSPGGT